MIQQKTLLPNIVSCLLPVDVECEGLYLVPPQGFEARWAWRVAPPRVRILRTRICDDWWPLTLFTTLQAVLLGPPLSICGVWQLCQPGPGGSPRSPVIGDAASELAIEESGQFQS